MNLLKDNDDTIKEGALNVVAKAGGTIREQLAVTSRYDCCDCFHFKCISLRSFLTISMFYAVL